MAMWLCGYVAKGLTGGTAAQVTGEPPARKTLTDLSSGLLEPQGKPGWGKMVNTPPKPGGWQILLWG